jgi:hypothetical protein
MRGKKTLSILFVCCGIAVGARSASAEVSVTMNGGRVTVMAKNATVGQILAEWAKVGQTKIVNAERVPGGPVTLELKDVPEAEALEVLLRSAGGYVLAPRRMETANASRYDRILILPQSAPSPAPRPQVATVSQPQPRPPFAPPQARPVVPGQVAGQAPAADDNDDQDDRPAAAPAAPVARPPVFNTFPQAAPQPRNDPPPPPPPTSTVTAPVGVAVPGMVVPTPQPAGQSGTQQQQQPR